MSSPDSGTAPMESPAAPPPPPPKRRPWLLVAVAVVVILALAGVSAYLLWPKAAAPKTIVYTTSSEMVTLDPSTEFSNSILILPNVYEGLTRFNPDVQGVDPLLATQWTSTSDGMNWTFTLRQGVKFHDNTPFNAGAVKFSVDRTVRMNAGAAFIWGALKGASEYWSAAAGAEKDAAWANYSAQAVQVVDEFHVKFVLSYPAPVDWIAASGYAAWIFSPNTPGTDDTEKATWFEQGHDSGTGPYTLDPAQYDKLTRVLFNRFADYWGGWSPGQFDYAVIRINRDPAQREASLKAGETDITIDVPVQDLPQLRQDPTLRIGTYPSYRALYAFFNSGQAPTDDPTVRQALAHAIPYGDIVTSISGGLGVQSRGVIPYSMFGHNESLPQFDFNLTMAQELLNSLPPAKRPTTLTLTYTLGDLFESQFAELYKEKLATLGITLDIQGLPWETQWAEAQAGPQGAQDIFVMYWWPSYVTPYDFLFNMFHSASYAYFNLGYYDNPTYDATIDEAVTYEATDRTQALSLYSQAQLMLYNDVPGLGIVDLENLYAMKADLQGFKDNAGYPLVVFFYQLSR